MHVVYSVGFFGSYLARVSNIWALEPFEWLPRDLTISGRAGPTSHNLQYIDLRTIKAQVSTMMLSASIGKAKIAIARGNAGGADGVAPEGPILPVHGQATYHK